MLNDQLKINRSGHRVKSRWPIWINVVTVACAVVLVSAMAVWTVYESDTALQANVGSKLKTILRIESEALRQWVDTEQQFASFLASDDRLAEQMASADLSDVRQDLQKHLAEIGRKLESKTAILTTADGEIVAKSGERWLPDWMSSSGFRKSLLEGSHVVSTVRIPENESTGTGRHSLAVVVPIKHEKSGTVGFLAIGHNAEEKLTKLLASSRMGQTGETIAVSDSGLLISQTRFGDERDSSVIDFFPKLEANGTNSERSQPLVSLGGRKDQRGVETVYVMRWMDRPGIGLITKMDRAEAFAPVAQMRKFVWTLFGLLLLTTISAAFYRFYIYRLTKLSRQAELNRKLLGAYELEEKIGEGGMGVVYRARHALLRRPTAIKILPPEKSSQTSIEHFEREVRYTSQLKHPNTISIYDYGRTENGLFYYAMELLEGLNLEQLIRRESCLPDGRVIEILRQVCESLREAHLLGLIHRDIKPENIILCNRGGAVDTVKVLDFGMVDDRSRSFAQTAGKLSGTPTYMAPESFTDPDLVDARVDVFAVGAVGFFLLTGKPLLEAASLNGIVRLHQSDLQSFALREIDRFAVESGSALSGKLSQLIASCTSNRPESRPSTVDKVLEGLSQCRPKHPWDSVQAEQWWRASAAFTDDSMLKTTDDDKTANDASLDITQVFTAPKKKNQRVESFDRKNECNEPKISI